MATYNYTFTITNGGTGYTDNDNLTFGDFTAVATTDGSGVVTTLTGFAPTSGEEEVTGELTATGGTGTGCIITMTSEEVEEPVEPEEPTSLGILPEDFEGAETFFVDSTIDSVGFLSTVDQIIEETGKTVDLPKTAQIVIEDPFSDENKPQSNSTPLIGKFDLMKQLAKK